MTKSQALYSFISDMVLGEAYEENSVPEDAVFPYKTYPIITDGFGEEIPFTISYWDKNSSWKRLNEYVEFIEAAFNNGSFIYEFDDGSNQKLLIKKGSPFAQSMTDLDDNTVKRKVLNFIIEFLTTY